MHFGVCNAWIYLVFNNKHYGLRSYSTTKYMYFLIYNMVIVRGLSNHLSYIYTMYKFILYI